MGLFTLSLSHPKTLDNNRDAAMAENKDVADDSCVLIVTKLEQTEILFRKDAYAWVARMMHGIMQKHDTLFEGEMKAVIPMGMSISGCRYKAVFENVPDMMMTSIIIPGMEEQGCSVKMVEKSIQLLDKARNSSRGASKRSRVEGIGQVTDLKATIDSLQSMRGMGGTEVRRQRFADNAMEILSTSVHVGSADLEEAKQRE